MHSIRTNLTALAFLTALPMGAARAEVHIVGSAGPLAFAEIQAAVDAALPGDLLLVGSGNYAGFTIDGKGLTVMPLIEKGMNGAWSVTVDGTVRVEHLGWKQSVVLGNIRIRAQDSAPALVLDGNKGSIRVQGCKLVGGEGLFNGFANCHSWTDGGNAAELVDCGRVSFADCELLGGVGSGFATSTWTCYGGAGGFGAQLVDSAVAFYDCRLVGGKGGDGGAGGNGGAGCDVRGFGIVSSGSHFEGGDGGYSYDFLVYGGNGGDALFVDPTAQAQLLDNDFVRGTGGEACCNPAGIGGLAKTGAGSSRTTSVTRAWSRPRPSRSSTTRSPTS